jgi:hypothetical protein
LFAAITLKIKIMKFLAFILSFFALNSFKGSSGFQVGNYIVSKTRNTKSDLSSRQYFARLDGEKADVFINRIYPEKGIVHNVFETHEWDSTRHMIIAFYAPPLELESDTSDIGAIGFAYCEVEKNLYVEVLIDTIYEPSNLLRIESVFFANADADKKREMLVTYSRHAHHRAAGVDGYFYSTNIYDNIEVGNPPERFTFDRELSKIFNVADFEGSHNGGKVVHAKFKTVKEVRRELKRLGY